MNRYKDYGKVVSKYMKAVIDTLKKRGGLVDTDWAQLDTMAWNYWLWQKCRDEVVESGIMIDGSTGNKVKNPAIDAANAAIRQANSIAEAYGLTPMSKKKLAKGDPEPTDDSPLAEWLKGNN